MRISEAFSGNFLKAVDLPQPRLLVMATVTTETIGEEKSTKPVLRFHGEQRGLVLNKVNSMEIASWYGDDTASWTGQPVELFSTTTYFSGRQVPCIRVRRPVQQYQPAVTQLQPAAQQLVQPQFQPVQHQQPQVYQAVSQQAAPVQAPNVPFDA